MHNFTVTQVNVVLKIYKILIRSHSEYFTMVCALVSRHGNWGVILRVGGGHTKKSDKNNEKSKRLKLRKAIRET